MTNQPQQNQRHRPSLALERILPNSMEAERAVLGSILLEPTEVAVEVRQRVEQKHFYYAAHQVIFREFCKIQDALQAVDLITLSQKLRDKNLIEEVGGDEYLANLIGCVPTTANVGYYIDIVVRDFVRRKVIEHSHNAMLQAFDNPELDEWLPQHQQLIFDVNVEKKNAQIEPFSTHVRGTMDRVETWHHSPGAIIGLTTGLRTVDKMVGGLKPGSVNVFAGRPGHGKSSLAVDIAATNALAGISSAIFSLEMTAAELADRTVIGHANVNIRSLQAGKVKEGDYDRITSSASKFLSAPLWIDDSANLTISDILTRARRLKLKHNIQLIVIDYIQLVKAAGRYGNREGEVAEVSRGVKQMAKELGLPVIAVAQLNRLADGQDQTPKLSWLRESGQLEQDADLVGFLVRPEMYAKDEEEKELLRGKAILTIAKQRGGPTGDIPLTFLPEFTRFEDQARVSDGDVPDGSR